MLKEVNLEKPESKFVCCLHETANNNYLKYTGPKRPDILVVMDCPDSQADRIGSIESSRSGRYILDTIKELDSRVKVGIITVLKCYTPKIKQQEFTACKRLIYLQLPNIDPTIILAAGPWSLKAFINKIGVSQYRGRILKTPYGTVVPTFSPGQVLDNKWEIDKFRSDIKRAIAASKDKQKPSDKYDFSGYKLVKESEVEETIAFLEKQKVLAFDIETNTLEIRKGGVVGTIAFSWDIGKAVCFPICHKEVKKYKVDWNSLLKRILCNKNIMKIAHNITFEMKMLRYYMGVEVTKPYDDLMLVHYVINENKGTHGLEKVTWEYEPSMGGYELEMEEALKKTNNQYLEVPIDLLNRYNCADADVTLRLWKKLRQHPEFIAQESLYNLVTNPLAEVIADIEYNGVGIDVEGLNKSLADFPKQQEILMTEINSAKEVMEARVMLAVDKIKKKPGFEDYPNKELLKFLIREENHELLEDFNINSTAHMRKLIFNVLKCKVTKKTPKGEGSVDKKSLKKMAAKHPIISKIADYKGISDEMSKYYLPLSELAAACDGRVRTKYHIAGTVSGRLSSSPNLQNIKPTVTKFFKPPKPKKFLGVDYSQLELRLGALLSGDKKMIDGFKSGADFHSYTYSMMYNVPLDTVTPEQRKPAKNINFGIWYGQSEYGLAQSLDCKKDEAKKLLDIYLETFTGVRKYQAEVLKELTKHNFVLSMTGRKRRLPEISSNDEGERSHAHRQAGNFKIQSLGSDMTMLSMIMIYNYIKENELPILIILTVHDSIVFELDEEYIPDFMPVVKRIMEITVPKRLGVVGVPIRADFKVGNNWKEMDDIK